MICPSCNNDQKVTEHNYGALFTCGSCQAVYFINFDGQPEFGEASGEDYAIANQELEALHLSSKQQPKSANGEIGSLEPLISTNDLVNPPESFEPFIASINSNSQENHQMESPFEFQNNMVGLNSDLNPNNVVNQKIKLSPSPVSNSFADIAQEISDFANTDSQLSGLNYDLVVTGIDTQETKNLFKEAIEDSKFAWDSFEILKSLKNGRVEINKISPAKAFLLAKRIQFLDIEKTWKQNAIG